MNLRLSRTAKYLASVSCASPLTPHRRWCNRTSSSERVGLLSYVVEGLPCPVHKFPMHRIPGEPGDVTGWLCHGYDGEGCAEHMVTKARTIERACLAWGSLLVDYYGEQAW